MEDFYRYYDQEAYLFGEVSERYRREQRITAFDFFCIVIWKANRAKSKIAKRLLNKGTEEQKYDNLQSAVDALIEAITIVECDKERMRVLINEWGFRLPMASAILSVLFPEKFTIYDSRVCEELHDFSDAQEKKVFDALWKRYSDYIMKIREAVPEKQSLRDKDRFLWGKSFALQLEDNITYCFKKGDDDVL